MRAFYFCTMNQRLVLVFAAFSGALAITLGALGDHGLEGRVTPEQLVSYKTGSQYHVFHSIVLLAVGLTANKWNKKAMNIVVGLFSAGIILFSGSIYVLAVQDFLGLRGSIDFLGPITPIGGLMLITAWISILVFSIQNNLFKSK